MGNVKKSVSDAGPEQPFRCLDLCAAFISKSQGCNNHQLLLCRPTFVAFLGESNKRLRLYAIDIFCQFHYNIHS